MVFIAGGRPLEKVQTAVAIGTFAVVMMMCSMVTAQPGMSVPPELADWKAWVMHNHPEQDCPSLYNAFKTHVCRWPDTLVLDFDKQRGVFRQSWEVLVPGRVPLPGDRLFWPVSVTVDGEAVAVVAGDGKPGVYLEKGRHAIRGTFVWPQTDSNVPQSFPVPAGTGLVELTVEGGKKRSPFIDENHRIWIQEPEPETDAVRPDVRNVLDVRIFRLIEDTVPMQVHNWIRLTVSGMRRRVTLDDLLLKDIKPVSAHSPLPIQLKAGSDLAVEVKPGEWDIRIIGVINRPVTKIGPLTTPYDDEIWSFKPHPNLRMVSVEGLPAIDPSQTTMPQAWKQYTSFQAKRGAVVQFRQTRRGSPGSTMDALRLHREMWLDFDGRGLTLRDRITGQMMQRRFLGLDNETYQLGRLMLNGKDQLVTRLGETGSGIEIEKGLLNLTAVSRMNERALRHSSPVGWNNAFQSAEGVLHIPPGSIFF